MQAAAKQNYIDAVRGWAILLVITSHVGGMFADLPYPVKKLTNFGTQGVQMFFLASAVTLLMSWHQRRGHDTAIIRSFFIRRFLRIAPMYYVGVLVYAVAEPPVLGFDPLQALRSMAFVNAWKPEWMATTLDWTVVPGGWSISVEFMFYCLFPALAALVTNLPRAMMLLAASLLLAYAGNHAASGWLAGYSDIAAVNFEYFWFPNQAPVFALGFVLYFLITWPGPRIAHRGAAYGLLAAMVTICVFAAEYPSQPNLFSWSTQGWLTGVPTILIATSTFMGFILVLARGPDTVFTHPLIRRVGTLSFSAYVLHFLFVHRLPGWTHGLIDCSVAGYAAIATAAGLWIVTVLCTLTAAAITHAAIEQPGIALARRLTTGRHGSSSARVAASAVGGA
jgi:peptidoglycan/LPS O-acetylase OafA/YrhL